MKIGQAVILAAGEGQRLRPFTAYKPKVMLPIGNKPVLQYVVEALAGNNIRRLIMVVGYHKEQVMTFFETGERFGVEIEYVFQDLQLGTAHALRQACGKTDDVFLVLSGDNIIEAATLSPLLEAEPNALLVKEEERVSKYGVAVVEGERLVALVEKPTHPPSFLVNTGIYLFSKKIFPFLEEEVDLPSAISRMLEAGMEFSAHHAPGIWLDAVYPWDILRLNHLVLRNLPSTIAGRLEREVVIRGRVSIGAGTRIRAHTYIVGPAVIGQHCEIGPGVCIFPSTSIGDGCRISPFCEVRNSVLDEGVELGTGAVIEDSVISKGTAIGSRLSAVSDEVEIEVDGERHRVRLGALVGEHCRLGENVVLSPGIRVGNRAWIRGLRIIEKDVPDGAIVL